MTVDATYFGYGVGLVLLGWVAGCIVGLIRSAMVRGSGI